MESYNIYKSDSSSQPTFIIVANNKDDKDILKSEYGMSSMIAKKRTDMPQDKDGNTLLRGVYYFNAHTPVTKESLMLAMVESINKSTKICKTAALIIIIDAIFSLIGLIITLFYLNFISNIFERVSNASDF